MALQDVCGTEQLSCQRNLLATISALIDKAGKEISAHAFALFFVVVHVMALQLHGSLDQEVGKISFCFE